MPNVRTSWNKHRATWKRKKIPPSATTKKKWQYSRSIERNFENTTDRRKIESRKTKTLFPRRSVGRSIGGSRRWKGVTQLDSSSGEGVYGRTSLKFISKVFILIFFPTSLSAGISAFRIFFCLSPILLRSG